jgi:quinol-cytochrome oxidoreductase complex cytochrome b subunit
MTAKRRATAPGILHRIGLSLHCDPVIPRSPEERRRYPIRNLVLHFRPATVPAPTLRFTLTFGLGGAAALLVVLQFATGILLSFSYEPNAVSAYPSVLAIIFEVPFGRLVRNLHYWCAHLLVLTAVLHLLRVFFTGAFHPPRQFNWIIGLALLAVVLAANFTGYLLPWNQLAYWAVTVSTAMLDYLPWIGDPLQQVLRGGASDIGPTTLRIFHAVHTNLVPPLMAGLMAFHFWRIRKAHGLILPRRAGAQPSLETGRLAFLPHLLVRECAAAAVLTATLLLLAAFCNAPLDSAANPGLSPNPARAPWYFAGFQELLLHLHPLFAVCIVPAAAAFLLLAVPYRRYPDTAGGVWFTSVTGRRTGGMAAAAGLLFTPLLVWTGETLKNPEGPSSGLPAIVREGLLPFLMIWAGLFLFSRLLKKACGANKNERTQALFILLATAFGVLTVTNVWFRKEGMALAVPW